MVAPLITQIQSNVKLFTQFYETRQTVINTIVKTNETELIYFTVNPWLYNETDGIVQSEKLLRIRFLVHALAYRCEFKEPNS
jgi:hypothetical protein